jgi:hypothetical protein
MADPTITCAQLIGSALRIAGITGRPGRISSPDQSTEAIAALNRMLGSWNCDPLKVFETQVDRYALTPQQTDYFIGPTGDFVAPRPIKIVRANIVLTDEAPELHKPLRVVEVTDWADIVFPELEAGAWPAVLYNDHAMPDSKLYLYPQPIAANDLELFTLSAIQQFVALTDVVELPDGYEEAIVYNLALRVASHYPTQASLAPEAPDLANEALARIQSNNAPVPRLRNDAAGLGHGARNADSRWWLSGGFE